MDWLKLASNTRSMISWTIHANADIQCEYTCKIWLKHQHSEDVGTDQRRHWSIMHVSQVNRLISVDYTWQNAWINRCTAQFNAKIKLASVTSLTPLRTDVRVFGTEGHGCCYVLRNCKSTFTSALCVTVCVSLPSSPFSLYTADQIKWTAW